MDYSTCLTSNHADIVCGWRILTITVSLTAMLPINRTAKTYSHNDASGNGSVCSTSAAYQTTFSHEHEIQNITQPLGVANCFLHYATAKPRTACRATLLTTTPASIQNKHAIAQTPDSCLLGPDFMFYIIPITLVRVTYRNRVQCISR